MDIGKFVSRSLGIGEQSLDEAARVAASIVTGDLVSGVISSSQLLASEKDRKRERNMYPNPNVDNLRAYAQPGTDDLGGIMDSPGRNTGVYEGSFAPVIQYGTQALSRLAQGIFSRGNIGGAAVGAAAGAAAQYMAGGDACGCKTKVFVRVNSCGQPIITRKMKKQAIEAVNCMGAEVAAATLTGGSMELLTMIISKTFPPRKSGITGAQLSTTEKTQRKLMRMHKRMTDACKTRKK